MPTQLDKMMRSKNMVGGKYLLQVFGATVIMAVAYVCWGDDGKPIFPAEKDPTGDPKTWTREELRRWLEKRKLFPAETATREELLERVQINMK
ncbi:hypothetical protein FALBO_1190 [Fusarium albosuccineum]|uniref:STE24 endopeptidase n=1 Tax=Fusarium albosuccineum TaxID=1237068 RepID=A0A8H4LNS1_9HYPO|nr:hypothetical protein FALBO_1190 [Fusarium albosuccineum]